MLSIAPTSLMEKNLFAYCNNNPGNYVDKTGTSALAVFAVSFSINFVSSCITTLAIGGEFGIYEILDACGSALISTAVDSLAGNYVKIATVVGAVMTGCVTGVISYKDTGNYGEAILDGVLSTASTLINVSTYMSIKGMPLKGVSAVVNEAVSGFSSNMTTSMVKHLTVSVKRQRDVQKRKEKAYQNKLWYLYSTM